MRPRSNISWYFWREKRPLTCIQSGKHAGGNTSLFFAINIQLLMTGQDNQRVFRGYRGGCHIWIYFIWVYLLSVWLVATGEIKTGEILNQNKIVLSEINTSLCVTFCVCGRSWCISSCFLNVNRAFYKLVIRATKISVLFVLKKWQSCRT